MYSWVQFSHLAKWCGVKFAAEKETPVRSIAVDSRQVKAGDVFVAYKGEQLDGHQFIPQAIKNGAVAIIAERSVKTKLPILVVKDGVGALVAIAKNLRNHFKGPVFAVTGSAGKSSTKEMLATLLGEGTLCSPASFNNVVGVSRTLFEVEDSSERIVLEMGMNARGEIASLCRHFGPGGGLITNIGDAHIGKLGSAEAVYRAKKELFEGIASRSSIFGVALNLDDARVVKAFQETFRKQSVRKVTYSLKPSADADVKIERFEIDPNSGFLDIEIVIQKETIGSKLPIFGKHHAQNIAAAVAGSVLLGQPTELIRNRLERIEPASHRGAIFALHKGITLIDESYNSNPVALWSSLESLAQMDPSRRRVLVLGDMLELGTFSPSLHEKVGRELRQLYGCKKLPFTVVGVGTEVEALVQGVTEGASGAICRVVPDWETALPLLQDLVKAGDIILIKSSRRGELDRLVPPLLKLR